MKNKKIDRRQFLVGTGSVLALPLLPSLLPSTAFAQVNGIPKRVVLIQMRDGTFASEFWPKVDPTTILHSGGGVYGYPLSQISGNISNIFSAEWNTIRNKTTIVRGLGYLHFAFHKACAPYAAAEASIEGQEESAPQVGSTIDCILENSPRFMTTKTPLAPLRLSPNQWGKRPFSWWRPKGGNDADVRKMSTITGERIAFDYTFKNFQPQPTTPPISHDAKVMDTVLAHFNQVINSRRISSEDKNRLNQHAESIQNLQKQIELSEGAGGAPVCSQPNLAFGGNVRAQYRNYMDTIANGFSCDLFRIATISALSYDDNGSVGPDKHHENSHGAHSDPTVLNNCRNWQSWVLDQMAYLVKKLESIPTPDGKTLLDHTVVVLANEDGDGHLHSSEGLQLVICGGGNEKLNLGYYLDYRRRPFVYPNNQSVYQALGQPWQGGLISIMNALGLDSRDWGHQGSSAGLFGDSKYQFPSHYINPNYYRSNPLPFLFKG